ncbi:hypothetical protein HDU82_002788, partial [Entophlyctis luteolus]
MGTLNGQRNATLIFAVDVAHIGDLVALFRKHGYDARGVHGGTSPSLRADTIAGFRRGDFGILINCGILTEGVDITRVDCIILGRPTRSGVLLQQMIGRGLRKHEGKSNCLVIDFADTCGDNDLGVHSTMPTLLGLRSDFNLPQDTDLSEAMEKLSQASEKFPKLLEKARTVEEAVALANQAELTQCSLTLEFEEVSILDLFDPSRISKENETLQVVSPLAWVRVAKHECVLPFGGKKALIIRLSEDEGQYEAFFHEKQTRNKSHWTNISRILMHDNLTSCIRACDSWIKDNHSFMSRLLRRNSPRRMADATPKQYSFLRSKGILEESQICTFGIASDMITKFIYGSKGKTVKDGVKQRKVAKL